MEGFDGLETGRALEAGLREDRRQLGALEGVDEGVDGRRTGRRRRRLRGPSNGDPVIAYECSRNLLDHQIWATL